MSLGAHKKRDIFSFKFRDIFSFNLSSNSYCAIIIRFKNGQHNIIDKIKDIRRNHKQLLLDEEYVRDREMINIISKKIYDEDIVDDKKRILSYMSDYDSEDLDIISYNLWLRNNL